METDKVYITRHIESGLKKGDTVRVIRKSDSWEGGWVAVWNGEMDGTVGKEFKIKYDNKKAGFLLDNDWCYPYFVLKKIA